MPTKAELLEAIAAAEAAGDSSAVEDLRERLGVGYGESLGRGAAQGATLGFGDEIGGAIQALFPLGAGEDRMSFAQRYAKWRDSARRDDSAAQAANPKTYLTGQVGSGVATAAAPGALLGKLGLVAKAGASAPWLERAAVGASNAIPYGIASGVGGSAADDIGGISRDAAVGGIAAGGIGAGVGVVAPPVAEWLRTKGIEYGRKALSGIATPMSHTRKPLPEAAVEEAYSSGAIRPWNTVTGIQEKLESHADEVGSAYDDLIAELERRGVTGPGAQALAKQLMDRAKVERPVTWQRMDPMVRDLEGTAREAVTKVDPLNTYTQGFDPPMPLSQIRALTGNAQQAAKAEYAKVPSAVSLKGDASMAVAGELRQAMEDAVASQASKAPAEAAAFMPAKAKLAATLQALQAAREGAGKAARRGPLSMTDMLAGVGAGAATGDLGAAGGAVLASKVISPRLSALLGSSARAGSQALGPLSPAINPSAAALSPSAQAELRALLAYLGRPVAASDDPNADGTR